MTGSLLAIVFITPTGVKDLHPTVKSTIRTSDPMDPLFHGLLTPTFAVVTLILTLNQLVHSQEFEGVKDQREPIEGTIYTSGLNSFFGES